MLNALTLLDQAVGGILSGFLSEESLASGKYQELDSRISAGDLPSAEGSPRISTRPSCHLTPGRRSLKLPPASKVLGKSSRPR